MKKIIILAFLLVGCAVPSLKTEQSTNSEVNVELLFEYDSIKVYRFKDNGMFHYFTKDMTIKTYKSGKTTKEEVILSK